MIAAVAAGMVVVAGLGVVDAEVRATRGLASHVDVAYGPKLRARSEVSVLPPFLVRVTPLEAGRQRIEFIGASAGTYDLRDFVEREDGQPVTDLASIPVSVVSNLPKDHGTDVFSSGDEFFNWRAHYSAIMWTAAGMWALTPVAYLAWRAMRKGPAVAPPAPPPPPPTVSELLARALQQEDPTTMTVEEKARLELLVFRYFAERLERPELVEGGPATAYAAVREDAAARDLVIALERWLHAPAGDSGAGAAAALLELRRTKLAGAGVERAGALA